MRLVVHRKYCSGVRESQSMRESRVRLGASEALFCQTGTVTLDFIRREDMEGSQGLPGSN